MDSMPLPNNIAHIQRIGSMNPAIAKEKAAIDHELSVAAMNLEVLHATLSQLCDRLSPVSASPTLEQNNLPGPDDYRGSSQVYARIHELTITSESAIRRVENITRQLEV